MRTKKIVTLGGGTGSFTLLSGLKKYPVELSAIVSMADDGGSTGMLRDELGVLPPGDVRQCLVALSESSEKMRSLMNYRFEEGSLEGHSFGNLFLSALEKMNGDFSTGVEDAMKLLNVHGEVIPVTRHDAHLRMILSNGNSVEGESEIGRTDVQAVGMQKIEYDTKVDAHPNAVDRIMKADAVVIGPGNHYCSILPNLVISDIARAIRLSRARIIYVANLTNKKGHTIGWNVDDYVRSIEAYIGHGRVDDVIFNVQKLPSELVKKYEKIEGENTLVRAGSRAHTARTYRMIEVFAVSNRSPKISKADALGAQRAFIRHDAFKLAKVIMFLLDANDVRRVLRNIV